MTDILVFALVFAGSVIVLPWLILMVISRPSLPVTFLVAAIPIVATFTFFLPDQQRAFETFRDATLVFSAGVCLFRVRSRTGRHFRVALLALFLIAILVLISLFFPTLPNNLVGLVGARAWLLYPVTFILGYFAFVSSTLEKVLRISCVVGLPVVLLGIVDAGLGAAGQPSVLNALHLDTQSVAAQLDAGFDIGAGRLTRVSVFFSFPLAYFSFTAFYISAALFCVQRSTSRVPLYTGMAALGAVACLSSGTRLALVVVPAILIFSASRLGSRGGIVLIAGSLLAMVGFTQLTGIRLAELPVYIADLAILEFKTVVFDGMNIAVNVTTFGRGAGTDTNAARDLVAGDLFAPIGGRWQESLLAKSWIELGFFGCVVISVIFLSTMRMLFLARRTHREIAPLAVFPICLLLMSLKGTLLEQAPAGIYVWFAIGVCLAALDGEEPKRDGFAETNLARSRV